MKKVSLSVNLSDNKHIMIIQVSIGIEWESIRNHAQQNHEHFL